MTESAKGDGGWVSRLIEAGQAAPDSQLDQVWAESARLQLPGPGWSPMLEEMHRALAEIDPEYALLQVSGRLRDQRRWKLTLCDECDAREPDGRPAPNAWRD